MVKLSSILFKRPLSEQAAFNAQLKLLGDSAIGLQARINLDAESRVVELVWEQLIDAVLRAEAKASSIRLAVRDVFRGHLLEGPGANCAANTVFGRAIPFRRFAEGLVVDGEFGSSASARSHVRSICGKPLDYIQRRWKFFQLGRYVMWSTFDLNGKSPFDSLRSCDEIKAALGLSREERFEALLLLEYVLPSAIGPKMPRVVEAYAGDDWVYFFRPAPESDEDHGWTLPWPDYAGSKPRPEVVHNPVKGDCLVAPLLEVK